MSPNGVFDKKAQIKSLGSSILYQINQGVVEKGKAVNEQLEEMGIKDSDIFYVLLTHLDCDHVNGLKLVAGAKHHGFEKRASVCTKERQLLAFGMSAAAFSSMLGMSIV